jgi:UDP-N-acetylglucosamine 2-epimerase (non-hydrolysing)
MKVLLVAGARPNFMKVAPLIHELERDDRGITWKLVHTGQHYNYEVSKVFFEDLDIPEPDYFLAAGSGTHAEQTAKVMVEFEKVCLAERPDTVVVVGDVNSTLACSVTARKLHINVAHVEAGLRSRDMSMPEEINRIVTDSISDYLFVTIRSAVENLINEGKREEQIFFVGNIMMDSLHYCLEKLDGDKVDGAPDRPYAILTLHRPSNVDDRDKLKDILSALSEISRDMPVHFPVHPRTERKIREFDLESLVENSDILLSPPLSYMNFLSLWKGAAAVFTDSGGLQEETTALGVPCFTLRENTERPVTVEEGTNTLVGSRANDILGAYTEFKAGKVKEGTVPDLWDGKTAERIIRILAENSNRQMSGSSPR